MGAIASGDVEFRNESIIHALQIPPARIKEVVHREHTELRRREQLYRGDRPQPPLAGKTAILVDDGIATGATMHAAVLAARQRQAKSVIVAVPVTSDDAAQALRGVADEFVALLSRQAFGAIGEYYLDFSQTSDAEVSNLLALSASERATPKTAIA
jgi:putative phosphoribosyl transferase